MCCRWILSVLFHVLVLDLQNGVHLMRVVLLAEDLSQLLLQGPLPGRLLVLLMEHFC